MTQFMDRGLFTGGVGNIILSDRSHGMVHPHDMVPATLAWVGYLVDITEDLSKLVYLSLGTYLPPPTPRHGTDIYWWPPKRAVRILLECFLVRHTFNKYKYKLF